MARAARGPEGRATRGTTGTNRLRRIDRWIAHLPPLRQAADPLVVDLGYGANGVTTLELEARLRRVRDDVEVLGLEIDADRVARATAQLEATRRGETAFAPDARASFARGGFEVPVDGGRRPAVIRAFNVLRQYDEQDVPSAWQRMTGRLAPGGVLVEGTCDEIGRVCSWIDVSDAGDPTRLTISLRLTDLERPSVVAERLPKALIHRNVPGERVHGLLSALDREWDRASPLAPFGPTQRWMAAVTALRDRGVPVIGGRSRWRLGELTVPWDVVRPA
ncbi:class I SAM-dependent methyltransferase [Microbacterium marinilacus]|uniref:Class I SAM-dependent methyltransferase n=1 Tax=Microbacterium marinilacus TaxID=415209 RepID=A0ABP7BF95_9MICO|nr:class I SAM-dependent methyltransferase [Microbacterium marinilacus]MBY0688984.1 class I SAM-dependent methyltransferase [Microbacterium marinilacus]